MGTLFSKSYSRLRVKKLIEEEEDDDDDDAYSCVSCPDKEHESYQDWLRAARIGRFKCECIGADKMWRAILEESLNGGDQCTRTGVTLHEMLVALEHTAKKEWLDAYKPRDIPHVLTIDWLSATLGMQPGCVIQVLAQVHSAAKRDGKMFFGFKNVNGIFPCHHISKQPNRELHMCNPLRPVCKFVLSSLLLPSAVQHAAFSLVVSKLRRDMKTGATAQGNFVIQSTKEDNSSIYLSANARLNMINFI